MNTRFFSSFPQKKARTELDKVLREGRDGIAIACAYVTKAGVKLLMQHADRLRHPDSFLVVANDDPTDFKALTELDRECPDRVFVHLGYLEPRERGVGSGLMHSKVFLASCADGRWLWVGSHNLTGRATQGINCEAAMVIEGTASDQVMKDACEHLQACRATAIPFRDRPPGSDDPPDGPNPVDVLVIHAELDAELCELPWYVHLMAPDTRHDEFLLPAGDVLLFLYRPGELAECVDPSKAIRSCKGQITAFNLTEHNPRATGRTATWPRATFEIRQVDSVLRMSLPMSKTERVETQALLAIQRDDKGASEFLYLASRPLYKCEKQAGTPRPTELDGDMVAFFSAAGVDSRSCTPIVPCRSVAWQWELQGEDVTFLKRGPGTAQTAGVRYPPKAPKGLFEGKELEKGLLMYRARHRMRLGCNRG